LPRGNCCTARAYIGSTNWSRSRERVDFFVISFGTT
jgi:hypothetical protein